MTRTTTARTARAAVALTLAVTTLSALATPASAAASHEIVSPHSDDGGSQITDGTSNTRTLR